MNNLAGAGVRIVFGRRGGGGAACHRWLLDQPSIFMRGLFIWPDFCLLKKQPRRSAAVWSASPVLLQQRPPLPPPPTHRPAELRHEPHAVNVICVDMKLRRNALLENSTWKHQISSDSPLNTSMMIFNIQYCGIWQTCKIMIFNLLVSLKNIKEKKPTKGIYESSRIQTRPDEVGTHPSRARPADPALLAPSTQLKQSLCLWDLCFSLCTLHWDTICPISFISKFRSLWFHLHICAGDQMEWFSFC